LIAANSCRHLNRAYTSRSVLGTENKEVYRGGETAAKANKNARIVVKGRKACKQRVEERKRETVALGSMQTRRIGESGPQLPSPLMKPDAGFLYESQDSTEQVLYVQK